MIKNTNLAIYNDGFQILRDNHDELIKCGRCGNTSFNVFITTIIDDARLYCAFCGRMW